MQRSPNPKSLVKAITAVFALLTTASVPDSWAEATSKKLRKSPLPIDYLLNFSSNPLAIEHLIFSVERPLSRTNGTEYYFARWQPDGFFFRALTSSTDNPFQPLGHSKPVPLEGGVTSASTNKTVSTLETNSVRKPKAQVKPRFHSLCCGALRNETWFVDVFGNHVRRQHEERSGRPIAPDNLSVDAWVIRNILSQVVNLGIPDLEIGSLQWDTNYAFRAKSKLTNYEFEGVAHEVDGRLNQITFRVRPPESETKQRGSHRDYKIEYEFDNLDKNEPLILPAKMHVMLRLLDEWVTFSKIHIYEIRTRMGIMPDELLLPSALLSPETRTIILDKNGAFELSNGKLVELIRGPYAVEKDNTKFVRRAYYISFLSLLTFGGLVLWKLKKTKME